VNQYTSSNLWFTHAFVLSGCNRLLLFLAHDHYAARTRKERGRDRLQDAVLMPTEYIRSSRGLGLHNYRSLLSPKADPRITSLRCSYRTFSHGIHQCGMRKNKHYMCIRTNWKFLFCQTIKSLTVFKSQTT